MDIKEQLSVIYGIEALMKLMSEESVEPQKRLLLDHRVDMLLKQLVDGRSGSFLEMPHADPESISDDDLTDESPLYVEAASDDGFCGTAVDIDGCCGMNVSADGETVSEDEVPEDEQQITVVIEDEQPQVAQPASASDRPRPADLNEETLRRKASLNLKNVFTLNDKFRFRRELFGGSDALFYGTVDRVEKMASASEAEEYFYGDLSWNPADQNVKDFMRIVLAYLKN